MQVILTVELRKEGTRQISNGIRQVSDGFLSVTGFRRIDWHCLVVYSDGLEPQSWLAAALLFCGTAPGRRIRSFFIL